MGPYYTRTVRNDKKDPISEALINAGVPYEEDAFNSEAWVFSFPRKASKGSISRQNVSATEQLTLWKHFALNWCEHKPSMTCYVKEHEWPEVGYWVWDNWEIVNGISFLPSADEGNIYEQAPYQDMTKASQEAACTGGTCEI